MPIGSIERAGGSAQKMKEAQIYEKAKNDLMKKVPTMKMRKSDIKREAAKALKPNSTSTVEKLKEIMNERRNVNFAPAKAPEKVDPKFSKNVSDIVLNTMAMPHPKPFVMRKNLAEDEYIVKKVQENTDNLLSGLFGISTALKFTMHYGVCWFNAKSEIPVQENLNNKTDANKNIKVFTNMDKLATTNAVPNSQELSRAEQRDAESANEEKSGDLQSNIDGNTGLDTENCDIFELGSERNSRDDSERDEGEI